jgi:hypothetical protein
MKIQAVTTVDTDELVGVVNYIMTRGDAAEFLDAILNGVETEYAMRAIDRFLDARGIEMEYK